jgi:chorismate mutase
MEEFKFKIGSQALSKRVHYGKFVAEAKFLDHREEYSELIRRQDSDAIMDLLTNKAVEKQVYCLPSYRWRG